MFSTFAPAPKTLPLLGRDIPIALHGIAPPSRLVMNAYIRPIKDSTGGDDTDAVRQLTEGVSVQ